MASGEYLLHYLLTRTSTPPAEAQQISDQAEEILAVAHELAVCYADHFPQYLLLENYYNGTPPLAREPERLTNKFRELLVTARSNWCGLVVDVVDERLKVGSIRSSANEVQDRTLWGWWQANNLDGGSQQIHTTALKFGLCYVSVWPEGPYGAPKIMGESPMGAYADFDIETGECTGAIRVRLSPREHLAYLDLTLPDFQFRLVSSDKVTTTVAINRENYWGLESVDLAAVQWSFRQDVEPINVNPLGVVPYYQMRTMPDLMGGYRSEIEGITPIQDRINRTNFDRLVTQEYAAFPQRYATGIDIPEDPKTGEPRNPFSAAQDRLWTAEDPGTRFGQFDVADLNNYLAAVTHDIQGLATQSRTPPHYLIAGMGQFPSGESVRATEYGLTRKIQARQQSYGDTWADVFRLAAKIGGKPRLANDQKIAVVWENVEARSEGEIVDALLKMASLQVPLPALWRRWGAKPEEVEVWEKKIIPPAPAPLGPIGPIDVPRQLPPAQPGVEPPTGTE